MVFFEKFSLGPIPALNDDFISFGIAHRLGIKGFCAIVNADGIAASKSPFLAPSQTSRFQMIRNEEFQMRNQIQKPGSSNMLTEELAPLVSFRFFTEVLYFERERQGGCGNSGLLLRPSSLPLMRHVQSTWWSAFGSHQQLFHWMGRDSVPNRHLESSWSNLPMPWQDGSI